MPVGAVGRWGSDRISKDGIRQEELELEYKLIDATAQLGCDVYITGCNMVGSCPIMRTAGWQSLILRS